jgi:hypothetical protein
VGAAVVAGDDLDVLVAPTQRRPRALDSPATAAGSEAPAAEAGEGGP